MKQLILGGARSGKSRLAEAWVRHKCGAAPAHYIATAQRSACDEEMLTRIELHRQQRARHWLVSEEPLCLGQHLSELPDKVAPVLIDCLTLWLSNCLAAGCWTEQKALFLDAVQRFSGDLVLVSNEVGLGIVPMGNLSRQFVDESGFLHQALADLCDRVIFTAAGLPLVMKGEPWSL
ncbi:bifunctional adenosylcobinamide kinase/adenosylcobinamide-phosphate guanylyltransferase [Simiduia curdlanivorans]|uniref:Bifunctional adenosylcobalamin biosynthesis protein n=1 Tax=Simiduia curdlanivorans TaxID=1492769 RepID=A0ABV8V5F0_9GAMM|nr:bifunctional adenosylcobinamide kinase/adenosylcobinamide-phosphate guanylyltransferase [Simiduia curdlanivorans]MDN3638252.1 bifunctional adenosylcobinamide kinase/adenosylcobinamide-phosphate guanylyltransferase [Simiduia curdlanivorans]